MKNFIPLLAILLYPCFVSAQQWRPVPEKKDNTIRVHGVTFREAVHKLIDGSYRLDKLDSNYQTIEVNIDENQTMFIRFDTAGYMIIRSELYIRGNMFANHEPILYYNSAFNRFRWDKMMKYAGQFSNIEYGKL